MNDRHIHHHHHFHFHHSIEARSWVMRRLDDLDRNMTLTKEDIMLDTSKLLESARKQSTENASLRALIVSVKAQLATSIAELAAAIANNDPVATAAAQKDIDDTVALLDADDAETAAALAENTSPAT
jgi:hypothetical protein